MKVALCLSGQPRSFEKGFEYYKKNLLDVYDVDVFLHTWYYDFFDYSKLIDLYKPKSIKVQKPLNINLERFSQYCNYNIFSLFYGIKQSYSLLQETENDEDFKYDWVVRSRYDYALNFSPDFSKLDQKKLYVPKSLRDDICNDQISISSSNNAELYSFTLNNIFHFIDSGCSFAGEDLLARNLKLYNVWNRVEYIDMNDPFPPDKYGIMPHSLIRDDFDFWVNK